MTFFQSYKPLRERESVGILLRSPQNADACGLCPAPLPWAWWQENLTGIQTDLGLNPSWSQNFFWGFNLSLSLYH